VAVEKIEAVYLKSELIEQIFVHGDSLHSFLVAIIVPDPANARVGLSKSTSFCVVVGALVL